MSEASSSLSIYVIKFIVLRMWDFKGGEDGAYIYTVWVFDADKAAFFMAV
jgi:hypothetical protein